MWTDVVQQSETIKAIYGEDIPSLESVNLHEITLHRDGPRISLRFDLKTYPASPPKKWALKEFNTVQITLMLLGISHVAINGWSSNCIVDIQIEKTNSQTTLTTPFGQTRLEIIADFLAIESISAYCG